MKRYELSEIIAKSREEEDDADLLTSYMAEDNAAVDGKFLRDTILNIMIVVRDTLSSALTWFIWLVKKNPPVLSKIREEIESAIPDKDDRK